MEEIHRQRREASRVYVRSVLMWCHHEKRFNELSSDDAQSSKVSTAAFVLQPAISLLLARINGPDTPQVHVKLDSNELH